MSDLFIHVQHLLGIGHLRRVATLANACASRGLDVTLASGGNPVENLGLDPRISLLQLPPLSVAPGDFSRLLTPEGHEASAAYREERLQRLLQAFRDIAPKLLMTELFPFGRRVLRHEFLALLDMAMARPLPPRILCSLRDILQDRTAARRAESLDWALRYYDRILVHGDPALVALEASFPETDALGNRLRYTGYIAQTETDSDKAEERHGVIVSCGGGAVGERLLQSALEACRADGDRLGDWLFLVGERVGEERLKELREGLPAWAEAEPNRADFPALLRRAALSISQVGYNTAVDLIAAGTPAVMVPYAEGSETEQSQRADALSRFAGFATLAEGALSAESLQAAMRDALNGEAKPALPTIDLSGAEHSAEWVLAELDRAPAL